MKRLSRCRCRFCLGGLYGFLGNGVVVTSSLSNACFSIKFQKSTKTHTHKQNKPIIRRYFLDGSQNKKNIDVLNEFNNEGRVKDHQRRVKVNEVRNSSLLNTKTFKRNETN